MNRRNFLKGMIVACAAPVIVKAENIMKIWVPTERKILTQVWGIEGHGGYTYSDELSRQLRESLNWGVSGEFDDPHKPTRYLMEALRDSLHPISLGVDPAKKGGDISITRTFRSLEGGGVEWVL